MAIDPQVQSLFEAIHSVNIAQVKYILEELKVPANSIDEKGQTALVLAASQGNVAIIELLVAAGAQVNLASQLVDFDSEDCLFETLEDDDLEEFITEAIKNVEPETSNFYASFTKFIKALLGKGSPKNEEHREIEIAPVATTPSKKKILFTGEHGTYYGRDLETICHQEIEPIQEINKELQSLGFQLLGKLTFSHFRDVISYGYGSPDESVCGVVMKMDKCFGGVDFVTCFTDETFLTTTTTELEAEREFSRLWRYSHPCCPTNTLLEHHHNYITQLQPHHGNPQNIFSDLSAVAVMLDEYLQRQEGRETEDSFDSPEYFAETPENVTPLIAAVMSENLNAVQTLLRLGAKVQASVWYETPPLVFAAKQGLLEIVCELVAAGANVNNGFDCLPLHEAANGGHEEVVRILLEAGAEVDAYEEDCWTALMSASNQGYKEVVQILLEFGANVNAWSVGETPLLLAAKNAHPEVYDLLYPLVNDEIRELADKEMVASLMSLAL